MVININPNRINTQGAGAGKTADQRRRQNAADNVYVTPKRADINHIPEPETLGTLIRSAVAALRQGVAWDRGTILNLVV